MYGYTSIGTPHLGLTNSSGLIKTAPSIINKISESAALTQLNLQDSPQIESTQLYNLSKQSCLEWFKHVYLMASD